MANNPRQGRALMVVGTCSDAGKSVLVAALCRIFARQGIKVSPFKSQNMSLNAGVTPEGHEIGRSTLVQAEAAGVPAHVDMNPVLLKPEGERKSQLVLQGRPQGHIEATYWRQEKRHLWETITASLNRLRSRFDLVIMEGAGSPAEINLPEDLANLRVARHAQAPALLVGDIDRGGVFASLVGTMMLLDPAERALVRGFVINKMRGDPSLLGSGLQMLQDRAFGVPTLGVVPFLPDIGIAEEDSVALDRLPAENADGDPGDDPGDVDIAVVQFPHLANFDDFDPLRAEPGVRLRYVRTVQELGSPTAVILPGTKTTLNDLAWLRSTGLATAVLHLAASGTSIVGICGGYQMLGKELSDPDGQESRRGAEAQGLGLLPLCTVFSGDKRTRRVQATCRSDGALAALTDRPLKAYEIHMGRTEVLDSGKPALFRLQEEGEGNLEQGHDAQGSGSSVDDGVADATGQVWGCYLHGLFDQDAFRHGWLATLGWSHPGHRFDRQRAYDRFADHVSAHLDMAALKRIVWEA